MGVELRGDKDRDERGEIDQVSHSFCILMGAPVLALLPLQTGPGRATIQVRWGQGCSRLAGTGS
jgi:hypothetical protein